MTFYSDLRDETAGPLIVQFGQVATYRTFAEESYDNATGKVTKGQPTDIAIQLLDLPMKTREFSEEVTLMAQGLFLVAAKEFFAASVTPAVEELIILGTKEFKILAINTVGPAGEAVIYKMAVQNA